MTPREIVGYRIREERERLGMTQAGLAAVLTDVSGRRWFAQSVGAAEQGDRAFTVEDLIALAIALGTDLSHLTTAPQGHTLDIGPHRFTDWDEQPDVAPGERLVANVERATRELGEYVRRTQTQSADAVVSKKATRSQTADAIIETKLTKKGRKPR